MLLRRLVLIGLLLALLTMGAAAQQTRRHTVQPGETLALIASYYGVTWRDIATVNQITNPNLIYVGQVLVIPAAGTSTPPIVRTYVIVRGDTLTTIAERFGTTVEAIVSVNNITRGSRLFPGQVLNIPAGSVSPAPTIPPRHTGTYYVVRPGDTLSRIAAHFRVNMYDLAEANGILNLNHIYVGQYLVIPSR
ncbi:MAG: LysM peptidoglycan-binding domain-containing protein [Anaerolineae bacterium]|jgi:LysM repeat protein|nr:LysM peptidoglycan-binding domain-containing protein [Anaerolineae bacterium]